MKNVLNYTRPIDATCNNGCNVSAIVRSQGDYRTAAGLEYVYGERRAWSDTGETLCLKIGAGIDDYTTSEYDGWGGEMSHYPVQQGND